jgi:uncharacterized protein YbjT (DUF2867 family)
MKILLTGANGYIGKRLLYALYNQGHNIVCCVRDKRRIDLSHFNKERVSLIEVDFENKESKQIFLSGIDVAYYLIHSMTQSIGKFSEVEASTAKNFIQFIEGSGAKQIIYLSGITNSDQLSEHLSSRKNVEGILKSSKIPVTILKAGIIIGSGSASFEIIRDLVEKLPVMITPRWLNTQSQPIAVKNVIQYLSGVILNEETYNNSYDIGGPEILTYKQMLLQFAEVRNLKRYIYTLPIMTPRLASYWLYFVTSTSYKLAVNLVNSMKIEVVANPNDLSSKLNISLIDFKSAVKLSFSSIEQNSVVSSWKDAFIASNENPEILNSVQVPIYGCFIDKRERVLKSSYKQVLENIWQIGGDNGWYYANFLWLIRGFIDKLFGGVGLRRGRTNKDKINTGDALDFWRVLVADKEKMRLLLYAEMRLPGEAWLEFKIQKSNNQMILVQKATFRPRGLIGRLYWYILWPIHFIIFNGMINRIVSNKKGHNPK